MSERELLKELINNGIRFKNYTNKLEIEQVIRLSDDKLTKSRDELNKLFLEAKSKESYFTCWKNEFLSFSFSIDEKIIGRLKKEENIKKMNNIKNEFFNFDIFMVDMMKKKKEVRIIMIKKEEIGFSIESTVENIVLNKVDDDSNKVE